MLNFSLNVPKSKLAFLTCYHSTQKCKLKKKNCKCFMQVNVPGAQDKENEPPEPTWAGSLAPTLSSEAATTQEPLRSPPEEGIEGLRMRTPRPILNVRPEKWVHKGKRYLPISYCIYNVKKAQERWPLKSHAERTGFDPKQGGQKTLFILLHTELENWLEQNWSIKNVQVLIVFSSSIILNANVS